MSKISSIGLEGIKRGMASANAHAQEVIQAFSTWDREPTAGIVGLTQDKVAVRASAALIKLDQKLDQAVLDILA